jgi:exosortase
VVHHSQEDQEEELAFLWERSRLFKQIYSSRPKPHESRMNLNDNIRSFRSVAFTALFLASTVVGWHPLLSTLRLAVRSDENTHILLILPISFAFICAEWQSVRVFEASKTGYGLVVLCAAGLLATLSRLHSAWMTADLRLSIEMLALVSGWIGSFALCFGARVCRALLFPLGFLFCMVPLPAFALDGIVSYLQQGSVVAARSLFAVTGIPVVQNGFLLTIPGLTIEVAKECSSIRSSLLLFITTPVLAQFLLRSPTKKAFVVALAVPLSVAKNGLRIFIIALLGTRVNPGFLTGKLHQQGGIVFFVVALLAIFLAVRVLEFGEKRASKTSTKCLSVEAVRPSPAFAIK